MTRAALADAKAGDRIKCTQKFSRIEDLFTVASVTATLVKCVCGASFRIDTGLMVGTGGGSGWDRRHGYLVSGEELASIEREARIRRAQGTIRCFVVSDENLEAAETLLKTRSKP